MAFDVAAVRARFPITKRRVHGRPLIYMDHGASTHPPIDVLDAVTSFCSETYANVHRGNHTLSQEASDHFEGAATTLASFVGANEETQPVIFVQNTTMALDLAAHAMAGTKGKTLTTVMEHHSNDLTHRGRGDVVHADVDAFGRVDLEDMQRHLDGGDIKLVAVTGCSNVTGYMPPIHKIARMAHDAGARILVDAAQLFAHAPIDVKAPDHPEHIDLLAAAGHKAYAPFGSAMLIGPRDLLDAAPPYMPGGGTVKWVTTESALFAESPDRHMGGTPNIVGAVAFAAAARFLARIGMENVRDHELELVRHAMTGLDELSQDGLRLLGPQGKGAAKEKAGVFSFLVPGRRHEHVSILLDRHYGIATRNGCFCAHPLLHRLLELGDTSPYIEALTRGDQVLLPGATRATVGIYNTRAEVDALLEAVGGIVAGEHDDPKTKPQVLTESP